MQIKCLLVLQTIRMSVVCEEIQESKSSRSFLMACFSSFIDAVSQQSAPSLSWSTRLAWNASPGGILSAALQMSSQTDSKTHMAFQVCWLCSQASCLVRRRLVIPNTIAWMSREGDWVVTVLCDVTMHDGRVALFVSESWNIDVASSSMESWAIFRLCIARSRESMRTPFGFPSESNPPVSTHSLQKQKEKCARVGIQESKRKVRGSC